MIAARNCKCLICRLEANLIAELAADGNSEKYRQLAASSPALSGFPTSFELIQHLHRPQAEDQHSSSDDILLELLRPGIDPFLRHLWHCTLLLAFIPTIHRTTSRLSASFPSLARDDIAQHLITVLLEFLHSRELRSRQSHLAFTIARKMRRAAFRWAIRESRLALAVEPGGSPTAPFDTEAPKDHFHSVILLRQFLDSCERRGWLSPAERQLLTESKIEGVSCQELSRRNGQSPIAIQHRIQRLIDRLRRLAQKPPNNIPQQLELFPK
jgi:DNA-directed RNA polymerase specialized sigma24 family protein